MNEMTLFSDTGFEIQALGVWGRARYLSVSEAPHNIESLQMSDEETFCLFDAWRPEWVSKPWSPTLQAGSSNHYTRALPWTNYTTFARALGFYLSETQLFVRPLSTFLVANQGNNDGELMWRINIKETIILIIYKNNEKIMKNILYAQCQRLLSVIMPFVRCTYVWISWHMLLPAPHPMSPQGESCR